LAPVANALMLEPVNLSPESLRDDTDLRNVSAGRFFPEDDWFHPWLTPSTLQPLQSQENLFTSPLGRLSQERRQRGVVGAQTLTVGSG